jgi:hypothetical protein
MEPEIHAIRYSLHTISSTLPALRSTGVENILQISSILTNKPNFPHFSPKNADCAEKQTQFKPNQSQFWVNFKGEQSQFKPNQTQFQRYLFGLTRIYSTDILDN